MSAKPQYLIEYRPSTQREWARYFPACNYWNLRRNMTVARFQARNYSSSPDWRVRYRGHIIAQWKDGKRVKR